MSHGIELNDKKLEQQLKTFLQDAEKKGTVTFREVEETLTKFAFTPTQKDRVYDYLEAEGVDVSTEETSEDFEIAAIEPAEEAALDEIVASASPANATIRFLSVLFSIVLSSMFLLSNFNNCSTVSFGKPSDCFSSSSDCRNFLAFSLWGSI